MPKHEDLKDPLVFQANELKKYFRMGDHVKVLSGNVEYYLNVYIQFQTFRI